LNPLTIASFQSVYFIFGCQFCNPIGFGTTPSSSGRVFAISSMWIGGFISIWGEGEKKNAYDALDNPSIFGNNTAWAFAGIIPAERIW